MKSPAFAATVLTMLLISSCEPPTTVAPEVNPSEEIQVVGPSNTIRWAHTSLTSHLNETRDVTASYTVPAGGADVYYLLTNTHIAGVTSLDQVDQAGAVQLAPTASPRRSMSFNQRPVQKELPHLAESGIRAYLMARNMREGRAIEPQTSPEPIVYDEGDSLTFIDAFWNFAPQSSNQHPSTLRKKIDRGDGHVLNVWVSDAAWDADVNGTLDGLPKTPSPGLAHGVTQAMVDALAAKFLGAPNNDIYSWVTALYGLEWPTDEAPLPIANDGILIDGGGQIHIFLANLNSGGTESGVMMGYFHSLNNVLDQPGSNEKVLFALDADSLANPDDGNEDTVDTWDASDYWPAEIISTLAHEFQHMIHYYQKQVKHNNYVWTDPWIDEMASMITEDLVADKLGVAGPRGVLDHSSGNAGNTVGRFPMFNYWHESVGLTSWGGSLGVLPSYSNSYAFGAWLLRNHGGPKLFSDIVTGPGTNYTAVVKAVNDNNGDEPDSTFASLVRDWGLATFLGSSGHRIGLNYQTALPKFDWSVGAQAFSAGSINPWNYRYYYGSGVDSFIDGPWVFTSGVFDSTNQVAAGATSYHWMGRQSAGAQTAQVTLPPGVVLTLVVQP